MNAHPITISIGRNVDTVPLTTREWRAFIKAVTQTLQFHNANVYVRSAKAVSEWNEIAEESRTWVAEVSESALFPIHWVMSDLCELYRQDAIAVTAKGKTTLVTARKIGYAS